MWRWMEYLRYYKIPPQHECKKYHLKKIGRWLSRTRKREEGCSIWVGWIRGTQFLRRTISWKKVNCPGRPKGLLTGPEGLKLFFDPLHIALWFLFHSLKLNFLSICDICKEPVKKPHQSADRPLTILVSLSTTKCMQISSRSNLSRSDRRTRHEASSNRATCSSLVIPPSKYGIRWNRRHRETVSDC